jgi:hypothetical protein
MRTAAWLTCLFGLIMIVDSGILLLRAKMLANRPAERWRTLSPLFRKNARQAFFSGIFFELLGCVLFILSFFF